MKRARFFALAAVLFLALGAMGLHGSAAEGGLLCNGEAYRSPFLMEHGYSGDEKSWDAFDTAGLFGLDGGDGEIFAYSGDVNGKVRKNAVYCRMNLEDFPSLDRETAQRLRAVLLRCYPHVQDISAVAADANPWLERNGYPPIADLQAGEAVLAAQQAVWRLVHGKRYTVIDPYIRCIEPTERETDSTDGNIFGLYRYFLSLEGAAPMAAVVSDRVFENLTYQSEREEGSGYTVTAQCALDIPISDGDGLTLSARCGGQTQSVPLVCGGVYGFAFSGLSAPKEIRLEVSGYQTGNDVYLFSSKTAQIMLGFDRSRLAVHGEAAAYPRKNLNASVECAKDSFPVFDFD